MVPQDKQAGAGAGAGAGPDVGADAAIVTGARAGGGAGEEAGVNAPRGFPLDRPELPQDGGAGKGLPPIQQQVPQPLMDKPAVLNEGNKAAVQADEFGEQRRQMRGEMLKNSLWRRGHLDSFMTCYSRIIHHYDVTRTQALMSMLQNKNNNNNK